MITFDVTSVPEAWDEGVLNSKFREVSEFFPSIGISISNGTKGRTFFLFCQTRISRLCTRCLTVTHYQFGLFPVRTVIIAIDLHFVNYK